VVYLSFFKNPAEKEDDNKFIKEGGRYISWKINFDIFQNITELTIDDDLILDVSPILLLNKLQNLTLAWLNVRDVSALALSKVHTLTLKGLWNVKDVSALSSVHTLTLFAMNEVTDVSALSTVHTLTLSNMSRVTYVSALSSVHTLTLDTLWGVTDVKALSEVKDLTLKYMYGISAKDVRALSSVKILTLEAIPGVFSSADVFF